MEPTPQQVYYNSSSHPLVGLNRSTSLLHITETILNTDKTHLRYFMHTYVVDFPLKNLKDLGYRLDRADPLDNRELHFRWEDNDIWGRAEKHRG